jgi:TolB-like protein/Tfp pilus assembly protein PilF
VTDPSNAVFLSYASQDSEAASRICEALRSMGVEVWFDRSELRGGDAWDQKIRREIRDCALFIPLISANTAARAEGYFRLEWSLADQRSHMIARNKAFIVPVCLDQTPESGADVPESFQRVQWTRLPGGDASPAFAAHIAALLGVPVAASGSTTTPVTPPAVVYSTTTKPAPHIRLAVIALIALVAVSLANVLFDRFQLSKQTPTVSQVAPVTPAPTGPRISEKSVAVLPFVDMSEKKDQEYFSDGLSEELIDMLTKVTDLRVPARTSSFYFKGKQSTIADIAKVLRVAHVLEGSVRKSGEHLRITAQLIRADDGYHVWSETYDRPVGDIFEVQDEIATAVVNELKSSLMGHPLATPSGTQNIKAYDLYLQAQTLNLRAWSSAENKTVIAYARKAVSADPKYAPAWAFLARALSYQAEVENQLDGPIVAESWHAAERALDLDPELAEAHTAAARIYMFNFFDFAHAQSELQKALALDPNMSFALALTGRYYAARGELDRGMEFEQGSIDQDPMNPIRYVDLAVTQLWAGKYSDMLNTWRKARELDPGLKGTNEMLGYILLVKGEFKAALAEFDRDTDDTIRLCNGARVLAYDALGRKEEADMTLSHMEKNCTSYYDVGVIYTNRGDLDHAFKWFDQAYRKRDGGLTYAKADPLLKNVHSDPRFTTLLKKMGLVD